MAALIEQLKSQAVSLCAAKGWTLNRPLGAGASAAVFEVVASGELRALKIYSPEFLAGSRGDVTRQRFDLVMKNLLGHSFDTLIKIYDGAEHEDTIFMLMDRAPGRQLSDVLKIVPASEIRNIVFQIASAAKFLEEKNICHRDIKSDNIVVSDDFKHAILLDLGVARWLDQDEGAGTDDGNQLPFVATARYSSPEYMFRLQKTGPELWRALTFYQLGGLLHDLINHELIFEDVVQQARENRYLIAYAVATRIPTIDRNPEVPLDLILLAERALDKDMKRRLASVKWDDFLSTDDLRSDEAVIGLIPPVARAIQRPPASKIQTWMKDFEAALDNRLTSKGIHCRHTLEWQHHNEASILLEWDSDPQIEEPKKYHVTIFIREENANLGGEATACVSDASNKDGQIYSTPIAALPIVSSEPWPPTLLEHVYSSVIKAAAGAVRALTAHNHRTEQ